MKKLLRIGLILLLSGTLAVSAERPVETVSTEYAASDADEPLESTPVNAAIGQVLDIKAKSAVLMEPVTGTVLYEANPDEALPPASITKIMSLLLVMEALDRGDISLETVVTASEHACSMGGSQIWLEPGESMTVDELLRACVIASANDACVALGELIAGSEEGFVAQMNAKAQALGMRNTVFHNCTGLDAEGHLTTAYDVALMSAALIKHDLIKEYSSVWMDSLRGGKSELVNTNKLVRFYEGATGLKTGTTSQAKYCLSATAERDGMELVAVVMAGESSQDRFNGAKKLLDYGFANYGFLQVEAETQAIGIPVKKGVQKQVRAEPDGTVAALLPKTDAAGITQRVERKETLTAPVEIGEEVGSVLVYNGEELLGKIPIRATQSVKKLTFGYALSSLLSGLISL